MRYRFWRVGVFLAASAPPLYWLYLALFGLLGPDPGKTLVDNLGLGALILLLITLAMTPLQQLSLPPLGSELCGQAMCKFC